MTTRTLSSVQLAALEADRLSLIVVPLDPQPEALVYCRIDRGFAVFQDEELDAFQQYIPLPYALGDRIETPHGNLIVTGVDVKRVQDADRGDGLAYGCPFPNWMFDDFRNQHGPDAFDRNQWCAFCTVEKEKTHALDRHVCECERWEPESECSAVQLMAEIDALKARHRADLEALRDELWQTVAKTVNPIKGTPYIAGPSPFCEAIRAFDLDAFQKQREGK